MRQLFRRLWYLAGKRRHDIDLSEEMAFHQLMNEREFEADGRDSAEAAYAARRALGNITAVTIFAVWRPSQLACQIDPAVALRRS